MHKSKRVLIYRLDRYNSKQVLQYSRWPRSFTGTCDHRRLYGAAKNTISIFELSTEAGKILYAGIYRLNSAVATTSSRFKITDSQRIDGPSLNAMKVRAAFSDKWRAFLTSPLDVLVPDKHDSMAILESLWSIQENREVFERLLQKLNASQYLGAWELQKASIETAMAMISLPRDSEATQMQLYDEDTSLEDFRLHEDSVIENDARSFPDMQLERSYVTGRAIFTHGNQVLHVITANRRPLETCLGADLIVINKPLNSVVLVQYKMLDEDGNQWKCNIDTRFSDEAARLLGVPCDIKSENYRLRDEAAFFKFVRRKMSTSTYGYVVPLSQLERLTRTGPKGGQHIIETDLDSQHISHEVFCNLVRTGYLGSSGDVSRNLVGVCDQVLRSNKALTVAEVSKRLKGSYWEGNDP